MFTKLLIRRIGTYAMRKSTVAIRESSIAQKMNYFELREKARHLRTYFELKREYGFVIQEADIPSFLR